MKRAREDRGNVDAFERITWDEALDLIEGWIKTNIDDAGLGRESIMVNHGTGRNINYQVPFLGGACLRTSNVGAIGFSGLTPPPAARVRHGGADGRLPHRGRVHGPSGPLQQSRMEEPGRAGGVGLRAAALQRRRLHRPLAGAVRGRWGRRSSPSTPSSPGGAPVPRTGSTCVPAPTCASRLRGCTSSPRRTSSTTSSWICGAPTTTS